MAGGIVSTNIDLVTDYTNEYVATLSDPAGNYCHAILTLIQNGSMLEGRFAFGFYTGQRAPDGWEFSAQDAGVDGVVLDPSANTARLRIGDRAYNATLVSQPVAGLILETDGEAQPPTWPQFTPGALDLGNLVQTATRLRLLDSWLASPGDTQPAALQQLENWRLPLKAYLDNERAAKTRHLAINPKNPSLHKDYSGSYSHTRDHSYTGNEMTGTLHLEQSGDAITGTYHAPAPADFVDWPLPLDSGAVTGEVFPDRIRWDFSTGDDFESWASNEQLFRQPGGQMEGRIAFCGRQFFFLKTADASLFLAKTDSVLEPADRWYPGVP